MLSSAVTEESGATSHILLTMHSCYRHRDVRYMRVCIPHKGMYSVYIALLTKLMLFILRLCSTRCVRHISCIIPWCAWCMLIVTQWACIKGARVARVRSRHDPQKLSQVQAVDVIQRESALKIQGKMDSLRGSSVKIGTIQRRLAWASAQG